VPVVHFTGEDGKITLSLNLQIHPQHAKDSDMTVDVGWVSDRQGMKTVEGKQMNIHMDDEGKAEISSSPLAKLRERAKSSLGNIQKSMSSSMQEIDSLEMNQESETQEGGSSNSKKK